MNKNKKFFVIIVSSFFYLGYFPIASGTVGTCAGFLICLLVKDYLLAYILVMVSLTILGIYVSSEAEHVFKEKDSHKIVIDEVVGYLVAVFLIPNLTIGLMIVGFFLNRIFDILKPWPLKRAEACKGGVGVMLDDILAGVYANIILRIIILLTVK